MTNRITGLATGLDIDSIIKQTMQGYRTKIDTQQQKKDILEIKQKLYRDVIKDAQDLYNTHFDILKSGSLISSKTWQSVKFTSSNESAVIVTGSSSAKTGNYTVSGTKAKAASVTLSELKETITINGEKFTVEGSTDKEKAINLNKSLTDAGVNISVRYTDFANQSTTGNNLKGFIFESKLLGSTGNFIIGGTEDNVKSDTGKNTEKDTITGLTVKDLKDNATENKVTIKIGNEESITIDIAKSTPSEDIEELLNKALISKKSNYSADIDKNGNITIISEVDLTNEVIIIGETNKTIDSKINDGSVATQAKIVLSTSESSKKLTINGVNVDLSSQDLVGKTNLEKATYINKVLEENGINVKAYVNTQNTDGNSDDTIVLMSNDTGENEKINVFFAEDDVKVSTGGENAKITIKDSNGGSYTHTGNTNSVTLDGITFNFTGEIPSGEKISVTSKVDASEIVEKVKSYIDDYNALIIKINTLTSEKRDRGYQPLTSDQKEEMSETEIELWESKVKQGQLRGDSDLRRIGNSLKQGMKAIVSGTGLTLEDIGIESVQDYGGTKDGTLKINEDELKKAIEDNTEGVMNVFMQKAPSNASESESYSQNGVMNRLKDILYKETVTSQSILLQKVGFEGTTTVSNNAITKSMEAYTKKISDMEDLFSNKEQALYSKYANLETIMNNYNSQMSYLSQTLGLSTS